MESAAVRVRPKGVTVAMILILIETSRVIGSLFLYEMLRGNLPTTFALPTGVGDVLIGITAPIVAIALARGGMVAWAVAITWNALGITDLVYAAVLATVSQAQYVFTSYLFFIPTFAVPLAIAFHVTVLAVLFRKRTRDYFVMRAGSR